MSTIRDSDTVLFTGDSITDCGRSRDANAINAGLGEGYVQMTAAQLLADRPAAKLKILNRGIGGNRVVDLAARWTDDTLALRPNVVSLLIGVNDAFGCFADDGSRAVPLPQYEQVYRQLLEQTRAALTGVRFVLCEPFLLRCGAATDAIVADLDQRRAVVRRLATEFKAVFVPFQPMFDEAVKQAPPAYWAVDGVHPTPGGHMLMARAWLKAVGHKE